MNEAKHALDHGARFPYDAPDEWWRDADSEPPAATDWAHAAARGILRDLNDRRGIKQGFRVVDEDVRAEIVQSVADIIRAAAAMANIAVTRKD